MSKASRIPAGAPDSEQLEKALVPPYGAETPADASAVGQQNAAPRELERQPAKPEPAVSSEAAPLTSRLRQTTDSFNFDALLSSPNSNDNSGAAAPSGPEDGRQVPTTAVAGGTSTMSNSTGQVAAATPSNVPFDGPDVTARLVEQLTITNERLERLEAALREVSLLHALQHEPMERAPAASARPDASKPSPEAQVAQQAAAVEDTVHIAEAHFRRGVSLCQQRKFDEAVAAWRQVLLLQPENPYALVNIGIVFTEQERWPEALDVFTRVLRLQPDNPEAHYGVGMAHAQLGNYSAAYAAWDNTLRLQPDNADARYNLELIRQRMALDNIASPSASPKAPAPAVSSREETDARIPGVTLEEADALNAEVLAAEGARKTLSTVAQPAVADAGIGAPVDGPQPSSVPSAHHSARTEPRPLAATKRRLPHPIVTVAAAFALIGSLVYLMMHWPQSRSEPSIVSGAPQAQGGSNFDAARTTAPLPSRPVAPTAAADSQSSIDAAPVASSPAAGERPLPEVNAPTAAHPAAAVAARPQSRSGRRAASKTFQVRRSRSRHKVTAKRSANPGFNRGADKLLDELP